MTLRYYDHSGKEIAIDKIKSFSEYHKAEISENGFFNSIETYENNDIDGVLIFIKNENEIDNILKKYSKLSSIDFCLFIESKNKFAKYSRFTIDKYNLRTDYGIEVYGTEMFPIYENQKSVIKYFYYPKINVEFEFEYKLNGEFKSLCIYDVTLIVDSDYNTIYPDMVGIGKNDFDFNWDGLDYYKNAKPELPDGEITTHNTVYN